MADDGNNPRRGPPHPEDNPFIAFRRFADSQVSSLLNTVFTLPATIANYNNAHQAREQCLFGKADERQCDKLHEIESEIADRRYEGRELFRIGDVQAVLRNSEELMRLDRRADELRMDIVGKMKDGEGEKELVQRVGTEKGQEWGWSHSWGWPTPFDDRTMQSGVTTEDEAALNARQMQLMMQLRSEARDLLGEKAFDEAMASFMKEFHRNNTVVKVNGKVWNEDMQDDGTYSTDNGTRSEDKEPHVRRWSRSWQWPPPGDSLQSADKSYSPRALENDQELKKAGVQWHEAYEDLLRTERSERPHCMRSDAPIEPKRTGWKGRCSRHRPWAPQEHSETHDEPSYEYSHDHEDQHDDPPTPKLDQKKPFSDFQASKEEKDREFEKALERQQERSKQFWELLGQNTQESSTTQGSQQQQPSTELDVYEQLLAAKEETSPPQINTQTANETKPSILSTLTTTERTVAPDGSVTTKVVLKKHFADGREESTETVHTQRGQEEIVRPQDAWRSTHDVPAPEIKETKKQSEKKSGWFWSS